MVVVDFVSLLVTEAVEDNDDDDDNDVDNDVFQQVPPLDTDQPRPGSSKPPRSSSTTGIMAHRPGVGGFSGAREQAAGSKAASQGARTFKNGDRCVAGGESCQLKVLFVLQLLLLHTGPSLTSCSWV